MQLCKDVYMVCGYTYSSLDNVYAIRTDEGTILIDTGTDDREWEIIHEQLAYWDLPPVTHVILSHAHINHTFNTARFQREGAKIVCSEEVDDAIQNASDRLIDYECISVVYNCRTFEKCKADIILHPDETIRINGIDFKVFVTHGHSAGGVLLLFHRGGKEILYTGDFIQFEPLNRHTNLSWAGDLEYDHVSYIKELKKLSVLEPDIMLPGHFQQCLHDTWQMPKNAYVRAVEATHLNLNPNTPY